MADENDDKDAGGAAGPEPQTPSKAKPEAAAREGGAATEAGADKAADLPSNDVELALLAAKVAQLEAEKTDLINRLLRAQADMDNLRKRTEREREETAKYAITKFARDVVGVADNFERAITSVPAEAIVDDPALAGLLEGVRMTEREFLNALERHGVKRLAPKGEPFDPHFHQAVMEQHDAAVPAGTVLQMFQAGYVIEDRCLRPAMVVVSKGGPKMPKPDPNAGQANAAGSTGEAPPADDVAPGEGEGDEMAAAPETPETSTKPTEGSDQAGAASAADADPTDETPPRGA